MNENMTLKQTIEDMQKETFKDVPAETMKIFQDTAKRLAAKNLEEKSLKKGDKIPTFSLPNIHGKTISSNELLAKGPLVITFMRGSWCPYCNLEFAALQKVYSKIVSLGANIISISPSLPEKFSSMETKHSLTFDLLSDKGNAVAKKFGLVFKLDEELKSLYKQWNINISEHNGDNSFELPFPATYIVDKNGVIVYSFVNSDYTKRAEPVKIIEILSALHKN